MGVDMFVLVNKKTGAILKAKVKDTSNGDFCNEISYTLNEDKGMPFLALTKEQAKKVLKEDSHWYNSTEIHPCHGSICPSDYEVKELIFA